jgi:hypothetical protein
MMMALSAQLVGCGRTLPAPAAPPAGNPPRVELPEVQPGEGVVVVEANEPSRVSLVLAHTTAVGYGARGAVVVQGVQTRPVCSRTPCAVSLPQGMVELGLQSLQNPEATSSDSFDLKKKPLVFRHNLGEVSTNWGGWAGGMVLAISGFTLGTTGLVMFSLPHDEGTEPTFLGMNETTTLAVSGLAIAGGIALMYLCQPTRRPGSSTTFELGSP